MAALSTSRPPGFLVVFAFVLGVGVFVCASESRAQQPAFSFNPDAVLDQYCVKCHNPDDFADELMLDEVDPSDPLSNYELWEKVIRKLRHRQMPPTGKKRPDESTYDAMAAYRRPITHRVHIIEANGESFRLKDAKKRARRK